MGKYIEGVRKSTQTESQRRGTSWHTLQEILYGRQGELCPLCCHDGDTGRYDRDCVVCDGSGAMVHESSLDASCEYLSKQYADVPNGVDPEDFETERAKLLYALHVYNWYWDIQGSGLGYEVIATEVPFELKVINPETGNACRDALLVGKIDKVIRLGDRLCGEMEHKSTIKDINPNAEYWSKLHMDTQTTLYPYALTRLQREGELEKYGIPADYDLPTTTLYDVTRVPGIKMKALSQAETNAIIETGEYCGSEFEIEGAHIEMDGNKKVQVLDKPTVDGHPVTVVKGKKADAFKETENMYGARVFRDMTSDPEKHFQRRELTRTTDDLARFEGQIYSIYRNILEMRKTGFWYECEGSCEQPFKCDYASKYCYAGERISRDNVKEGFELMW
jgi:hypothetical protein